IRFKMAHKKVSCGLDFSHCSDIQSCVDSACKSGYDFISVPIFHPRFKREFMSGPARGRTGPQTRSDMVLTANDWGSLVVGKITTDLALDSPHALTRKNAEKMFLQELNYMAHLSVPAVLIKLRNKNCVQFARSLNEHGLRGFNQQYWVQVPMKSPIDDTCDLDLGELADDTSEGSTIDGSTDKWKDDTWEWWNQFRTMCDGSKKLGVALELTADLPSDDIIERWLGEPVKVAILPTSIFLTNKKGFPVLSKAHQGIIKALYKLDTQMIITGANRHPEKGIRSYQQYLEHLWQTREPLDPVAQFAKGYEDYLQCPLQPLMDNLESQTYEVFEKDPVKYSMYQKAVYSALLDRVPMEEKDTKVTVIMVVGAGRGPLVNASIQAASKAERKVRLYAVEKNPNAIITLMNLKEDVWGDLVTVVSSDMRVWKAPEQADILVSELLGSFSDNELSPECLDGAQVFLKDDGISIPCDYTSFIAPLQSHKLYNEVRQCKDKEKPVEAAFEVPYVVRLHNCHLLDKPKPVFYFQHPNREEHDNSRYSCMEFDVKTNAVIHGLGGYFETTLYKDIFLSIVPETHSHGMFSWFPMLFPIREPMYVRKGDKVILHFWRRCTEKNVWYEWCISGPTATPIHNPKGRSYMIGL
ncbi:unnamed protein product, partial [Owenia fusiformis]